MHDDLSTLYEDRLILQAVLNVLNEVRFISLSYDLSQKSLNRYENEAYNAKVEESVAK
jgi:hypothetical protein